MNHAVLRHFGLSERDRLGTGWESEIYALNDGQILRIPRPEPGMEERVRERAAFSACLPAFPYKVPNVHEIAFVDKVLVLIEERIAGRPLSEMLPELAGARRLQALDAYLSTAEGMALARTSGEYGDLLVVDPVRTAHWSQYLIRQLDRFVQNAALARDVAGLDDIAADLRVRLEALPDPDKCVVHGDIWPPNVMLDDDLQVTGLLDFSFTTRVGDTVMDLAGAAQFLRLGNPLAAPDFAYLFDRITRRHGPETADRVHLYGLWFAFSFAHAQDDPLVYPWCLEMIRGASQGGGGASRH